MTITSRDQLIDALANNSDRIIIDKASIASQTAGGFTSLWRATGQPGQGAIPTTAARCDNGLLGSMGFANQTAPAASYLAWLNAASGNAATVLEVHDRIAHMGGLVLNSTTSQTVNLDLTALSIPSDRLGSADPTLLNYTSHYTLTATSETVNSASAYDTPSGASASSLAAGNVAIIEGIIQPSANGTVIARFASEVSSSAVVAKAGAVCYYQQVA